VYVAFVAPVMSTPALRHWYVSVAPVAEAVTEKVVDVPALTVRLVG
jgi:hypothetical protein